jgi:hypothetical protein
VSYQHSDLAILIPMLGRPTSVAPLVESIAETTAGCRTVFLLSPDDNEVYAAIDAIGAERFTVPRERFGDYARKINIGYRLTTEPLLFTAACDLRFHVGWFEAAIARLGPGVGVVGTNDLGSPRVTRGDHATHFLVTRDYAKNFGLIDKPDAIFCELYPHEYVDDELVGTAKKRGAWTMALDSHVEHRHPDWCPDVPTDPLYSQQRQRMANGRPIYLRRRRLWT